MQMGPNDAISAPSGGLALSTCLNSIPFQFGNYRTIEQFEKTDSVTKAHEKMSRSISATVFLGIVFMTCMKYDQAQTIVITSPKSNYTLEMKLMTSPYFSMEDCRISIRSAKSFETSPWIRQKIRTKEIAVEDSVMDLAVRACVDSQNLKDNTSSDGSTFTLEYPGTKWCGPGNIAEGYEDLGEERMTDMCCRDHDHCPNNIAGGESKYGLKNNGLVTISHCDCDRRFRECLKKAGDTAYIVANLFFNVFKLQCFRKDYPIIRCVKKTGFFDELCEVYELDKTRQPIYQMFDNPTFDN